MTDEEEFEEWWKIQYSWPLELCKQDLKDAWLEKANRDREKIKELREGIKKLSNSFYLPNHVVKELQKLLEETE